MPSSKKFRAAVQEAAAVLHSGGLVAFPTETVYGLGADAENPQPWPAFLRRRAGQPTIR